MLRISGETAKSQALTFSIFGGYLGMSEIFSPTRTDVWDFCNIQWLAGLLEGEGCFTRAHPGMPRIECEMTDEDTITRVSHYLGAKYFEVTKWKKHQTKPTFRVQIAGTLAVQWMMTLYTLMGIRRRARIAELLREWRAHV